uniref:Uncharacterized protein n=1 Tax=Strongyloides venezuelensis TaxID=75913 RepID=A0A0K0FZQ1_STRVS
METNSLVLSLMSTDVFFKSPFSKEDKRDGRNSRIEFLETAKNLYNINFDINGKKFSRCLTIRKQNLKVKFNTVETRVDSVCIRVENYCQKESDKSKNQLRHISPEEILLTSLSMDVNFILFQDSTDDEEIKFVREEKFIAVMKGREVIKKFKSPIQSILFCPACYQDVHTNESSGDITGQLNYPNNTNEINDNDLISTTANNEVELDGDFNIDSEEVESVIPEIDFLSINDYDPEKLLATIFIKQIMIQKNFLQQYS